MTLPLAKASNAGSSSEKGELSTTLSSLSEKGTNKALRER
jgi:hypothetical protein